MNRTELAENVSYYYYLYLSLETILEVNGYNKWMGDGVWGAPRLHA